MAPKGNKRAAAAIVEEPGAKRVKEYLKQQGVTKSTQEGIKEIVQHPLAGLPEDCRDMLVAMLPWSLFVPVDQRGELHGGAIKMIEEVAATIKGKLEKEVEAETRAVGAQDAKKNALQQGVQVAEAAAAAAVASAEERKKELADASTTLAGRKQASKAAEAKALKDAAGFQKEKIQKLELETVMQESFQKLKAGTYETGQGETLFKPVKKLIGKLVLDESLVTSLPVSLMKKERGQFDQVVVDKFEESLREKISEHATKIGTMESEVTANSAAVEATIKDMEAQQQAQTQAAGRYGDAQEANAKAAVSVAEAQRVLEAFEPEYKQATAVREDKEFQLHNFKEYSIPLLQGLIEQESKEKQKADAAAAKAVERAAAEAAAAEAAATEAAATEAAAAAAAAVETAAPAVDVAQPEA